MVQPLSKWPEATRLALLVREAQQDAPGALDRLLSTLRPALLEFFSGRLPHDAAEDSAQAALLRVTGALRRIDPERADAYVTTVARNLLRTAYRHQAIDRRRRADLNLGEVPEHRDIADARVEYEELVRAVHRVIAAKLSPTLAEIVWAVLRGETPTEIATRQGVSPVTVRTRLMRARALLRKEMSGYLDSSEESVVRTQRERRRLSG